MDYKCRLGSLGNLSTASWRSDPVETVGQSYSSAPGLLFIHAHFILSILILFLFAFFLCFFVLFHPCCSHAPVCGKTPLHEFHISYSDSA